MHKDLTSGSILKSIILFSLPLILGNLLQQLYNIVDSIIVGKFVGEIALGAVGSAYSLTIFLTSIFLGLSMGSGVLCSIFLGQKDIENVKKTISHSFILITILTLIINIFVYIFLEEIIIFLKIPFEAYNDLKDYLEIIFFGLVFVSLYNYLASILRSLGNSTVPLIFLLFSSLINIGLDLLFVIFFHMGIKGAGLATLISQVLLGISLFIYVLIYEKDYLPNKFHFKYDNKILKKILNLSFLTCVQQASMNFGILLIQRLIDAQGVIVMSAFSSGVKIDTFAYLPVQDFGNGFATFVSVNYGSKNYARIRKGFKYSLLLTSIFSICISILIFFFGKYLLLLFIDKEKLEIIEIGVRYLRIEGSFYIGIGILFLLYGFYRAINKPYMSLILTIVSLGLRVLLAYSLVFKFGIDAIFAAIPIGWFSADFIGLVFYLLIRKKLFKDNDLVLKN